MRAAKRVAWLVVVWAALFGCYVADVQAQQVEVSQANRTISITATENAERRADTASLRVGFRTYAADSAHAYTDAARLSQAISDALTKAGVANDAIESDSQSTEPTQGFQNQNLTPDERAQRRYEAHQSGTVRTTPDAVARLLAAAVDAGANESGQIDWSVADEASLTAEAGTKALEHAQRLAAQMAKNLGAKVGSLLYATNQVEIMRPLPVMRATVGPGMGGGIGASRMAPQLNLSAPMITRPATVSAIFSIQ